MTQPGADHLPLTELLTPADLAGVADAVRRSCERATPLYPIGGGTRLSYGAVPVEPGVGLSLGRLDRLVDYPARDLTITVQAGMTLAELAGRLAAEGQRLPVDVPRPDRATVGGVLSTSVPGPRQYGCGTIRDYVIGLRAVDGSGTPFAGGGRVVKNAAGYDLCRLLTGSLGTLAVIVEVTLMVKPRPECSALLACPLCDWEHAERLLAGLVHSSTLPAAIELVAGPAWQDDPLLGPLPPSCVAGLVVGLEGTAAEVEWMIGRLQEELGQAGGKASTILQDAQADLLWGRLTEFPSAPAPGALEPVVLRVHVLPDQTVQTVEDLLRLDPAGSVLAHAGNGMILARLSLAPDRVAELLEGRLRPELSGRGGSAVVLSQPTGAGLGPVTVWGPRGPAHALMQSIKDQFDPRHVLNRGRFVFASPTR